MKEKQKEQRAKKKSNLREKGITLIALVVTIIILLILAGVAIASVTGDNGLFRKAREATNMYKDAERDEQGVLGEAENEISKLLNPSGTGGGSGGNSEDYATGNTPVTVSDGTYYIPDGFKLAEDSGTTINEGIVVEDKNGNQWVWIPCYVEGGAGADVEGRVKFDRYKFAPLGSEFYDHLDSNDETSIRQFGGYYIGRYEAGDKESTIAKEMRTEEKYSNEDNGYMGDDSHTVTIKKGQVPYNYVCEQSCEILSSDLASANNYDTSKMYTKLCSGYTWETALKFIGGDYATNATQGNYKDTTFNYTDITGASQTKRASTDEEDFSTLVPTGQTTAVKNIYDMGGNLYEYTVETSDVPGFYGVVRGGSYDYEAISEISVPAGGSSADGGAYGSRGFRPTLFLNGAES